MKMGSYRRSPRERVGLYELFREYGALPEARALGPESRSPVELFQIRDPESNMVWLERNGFLVIAAVAIKNCDGNRVQIDDVSLRMSWDEQVHLFPDPRKQKPTMDYYPHGFAREIVLNHRIASGKCMVGHGGSIEGLLLGTIESCPPASTQIALIAEFSITFTNGSASHVQLVLSNLNSNSPRKTLSARAKLPEQNQLRVLAERRTKNSLFE
jgi:hypothetical protein